MMQFRKAAKMHWQNGQNRFLREVITKGSILLTTLRPNGESDQFAMWMPSGQHLIDPQDLSTIDRSLEVLERNFQTKWENAEQRGSG